MNHDVSETPLAARVRTSSAIRVAQRSRREAALRDPVGPSAHGGGNDARRDEQPERLQGPAPAAPRGETHHEGDLQRQA